MVLEVVTQAIAPVAPVSRPVGTMVVTLVVAALRACAGVLLPLPVARFAPGSPG
jgi:hypothetical protein